MNLETVWDQQSLYNVQIREVQNVSNWDEAYLLGLASSIHQIQAALKLKRTVNYGTASPDPEQVLFELADCMKFLISLCQNNHVTPQSLLRAVYERGQELELAFPAEFGNPVGRNIIVSDLDGSIADYRKGFSEATHLPDQVRSLSFDLDNNVSFSEYQKIKYKFETTGGYWHLPSYPDAIALLKEESIKGTLIYIVTARPHKEVASVRQQTIKWLNYYGVPFDALSFCSDERIDLVGKLSRSNNVILIEDNPTLAMRSANAGLKVLLRKQPYNDHIVNPNITKVDQFPEAIEW